MIACDKAYPYLGRWTCLNGDDKPGTDVLDARLKAATARLRRVRRRAVSRAELNMMGDALIGWQGGVALQTMHISFQQADVYEARSSARWRGGCSVMTWGRRRSLITCGRRMTLGVSTDESTCGR